MNYLAHIYLSGEDEHLKIGNFIADSVKGRKFIGFPEKVKNGIILHRAMDTFTDSHPVVKKSVHRLFPVYSHYSAVIVDILYDHFLAANWSKYSKVPLEKYVAEFYELLNDNFEILPKKVKDFLPYMIRDNWLLNYATIEGIGIILFQMDQRTKNRSKMQLATTELKLYYSEFEEEFRSFFTDLENFCNEQITKLES
ncbi:ACP phosphodiesterase [Gillisia limnaea]|uniref:Acyl carrier protein phosphodiesterase n=1 Tax=Gillisia limnaea (strain DSM 15749 / LMG 21470 / R-8282) TaxID=865937 RepID=H2BSC2_GILLR|nr:acyl carrier protein phosphodiesterase [Gillisia limnaea]EHQ01445.1 Acyl carrier protein phosphodiesterase [Gillisia limnaea DSM 15749]